MNDSERISRLEAEVAALKQRTGPSGLTVGPGLKISHSANNARLELASSIGTTAGGGAIPAPPTYGIHVLVSTGGRLEWIQCAEFACPI